MDLEGFTKKQEPTSLSCATPIWGEGGSEKQVLSKCVNVAVGAGGFVACVHQLAVFLDGLGIPD